MQKFAIILSIRMFIFIDTTNLQILQILNQWKLLYLPGYNLYATIPDCIRSEFWERLVILAFFLLQTPFRCSEHKSSRCILSQHLSELNS